MKKIFLVILAAVAAAGCSFQGPKKTAVLCGTSMIFSMVKDCGAGLKNSLLIPSEVCPGGYDLKPGDAEKIKEAAIFIIHPYQKDLADRAAKINPAIKTVVIATDDLTIPENYFRGLQETAAALCTAFPPKSGEIINSMNANISAIRERVIDDSAYLMKLKAKKIKVVSCAFQAEGAKYLGFDVLYVFGDVEKLRPKDINDAVAAGRRGASFIISNLTGTQDASADAINRGLRIKKIILSTFPGVSSGTDSLFLQLWEYNLSMIKAAAGN
jgi:zinc transport system substrate-binding protein